MTEYCAVIGTHSTVRGEKLLYGLIPDPFPRCGIGSGHARLHECVCVHVHVVCVCVCVCVCVRVHVHGVCVCVCVQYSLSMYCDMVCSGRWNSRRST